MLRVHFMPQWFTLSDPGLEDAFFDTALYRELGRVQTVCDTLGNMSGAAAGNRLLRGQAPVRVCGWCASASTAVYKKFGAPSRSRQLKTTDSLFQLVASHSDHP